MKEESIRKINKMGHAGQIIANICKVLLIIGVVFALLGSCFLMFLPEGAVTASPAGSVEMTVDVGALGYHLTDQQRENLLNGNTDLDLSIGGDSYSAVEVNGDVIRFTGGGNADTLDLHRLGVSMLLLVLSLIAITVTMFFVASLCKALRYCETPFSEDIVTRIRRVAWSLIPWALLGGAHNPFEALSDGSIDMFIGIDLQTVLLILIIFALSFIFRYGAMLQQESDETL
ncbi:MAG: DUF2975 domain-containing protein [Firmicutes bacterium]|nr:DUF2975 domain-containing protein [Bacillota bacterium]